MPERNFVPANWESNWERGLDELSQMAEAQRLLASLCPDCRSAAIRAALKMGRSRAKACREGRHAH